MAHIARRGKELGFFADVRRNESIERRANSFGSRATKHLFGGWIKKPDRGCGNPSVLASGGAGYAIGGNSAWSGETAFLNRVARGPLYELTVNYTLACGYVLTLETIARKVGVFMKVSRLIGPMIAALTLLTLLVMPNLASAQAPASLLATANGKGTLTVGREEFKVTSVVVKLKEDGTAEITVVTDLQLFVTGTWSKAADSGEGIDLKITGGATGGGTQGSGKLLLRPDGKSIDRLTIEAMSNTVKRKIRLEFVAD